MAETNSTTAPDCVAVKICSICNQAKAHDEFNRKASSKDGLNTRCRECDRERKRADYYANHEANLAKMKAYREAHPEKVSAAKKSAYLKKHAEYLAKNRDRYQGSKESMLAQMKAKRLSDIDAAKAKERETYKRRAEKMRAYMKGYYLEKKEEIKEYRREYWRKRRVSDPVHVLAMLCRRRLLAALKRQGLVKAKRTEEMLGCSVQELKVHLEKQFIKGMTWENRGEWHIDHIVPLASAKTEDELESLFHFTNLRPLWGDANRVKSDKLEFLI